MEPLTYRVDFIGRASIDITAAQALAIAPAMASKGIVFLNGGLYQSHQITSIEPCQTAEDAALASLMEPMRGDGTKAPDEIRAMREEYRAEYRERYWIKPKQYDQLAPPSA